MSQMSFNVIEQMVLVRGKQMFAFVIYCFNFMLYLLALDTVTACLVVAMNDFVADCPDEILSIPNAG